MSLQTGEVTSVFPLYLYPEEGSIDTERRPNLDEKIWKQINEHVGHETSPEEIFDYIYGVLHSPSYRERYKEFLKVDFPRIPYPQDLHAFEHYVYYGHKLRELHLMHTVPAMPDTAMFTIEGDNKVDQVHYEHERVYINRTQYFDHVPAIAWDFFIGGYQPAQKWLKDRKTCSLSYDDICHYANIIRILLETNRLMQEIDSASPNTPSNAVVENADSSQPTVVNHYHVDNLNVTGTVNIAQMNQN